MGGETSSARPFVVSADALGEGDYVAPGLEIVRPDRCFPHMVRGDAAAHPWPYLRREIGHAWYVDEREPLMGFLNRDEAVLLYNLAKSFAGRRGLEIGCWRGWSTVHLALGGVALDVIDPVLADPDRRAEIEAALGCAGVAAAVTLHPGRSPESVAALAAAGAAPWSLFFIDGDHECLGPERDVEACLPHAAADAAFVFHDLASPHVAEALRHLEANGFHLLVYQTMQIMGLAWRGAVAPVRHVPDPKVPWQLPHHLVGLPVAGIDLPGYPAGLRRRLSEAEEALARTEAQVAALRRNSVRGRLKRLVGLDSDS